MAVIQRWHQFKGSIYWTQCTYILFWWRLCKQWLGKKWLWAKWVSNAIPRWCSLKL